MFGWRKRKAQTQPKECQVLSRENAARKINYALDTRKPTPWGSPAQIFKLGRQVNIRPTHLKLHSVVAKFDQSIEKYWICYFTLKDIEIVIRSRIMETDFMLNVMNTIQNDELMYRWKWSIEKIPK